MQTHFATTSIVRRTESVAPAGSTWTSGMDLDALQAIGTVVTVPRGAQIFAEGDRADCWYKVVSGTACLSTLLADGRRQIGAFFHGGAFFGFESPREHRFSAEALTRTTLVRYPRSGIERVADRSPALNRHLREIAFDRLCAAQARLLLLGRKTAIERLATFLIEMLDRSDDDRTIELTMSRGDIGDYLGLNLETVSRSFSLLKGNRVIALPSVNLVHVVDRDVLEDLASGEEIDAIAPPKTRRFV